MFQSAVISVHLVASTSNPSREAVAMQLEKPSLFSRKRTKTAAGARQSGKKAANLPVPAIPIAAEREFAKQAAADLARKKAEAERINAVKKFRR